MFAAKSEAKNKTAKKRPAPQTPVAKPAFSPISERVSFQLFTSTADAANERKVQAPEGVAGLGQNDGVSPAAERSAGLQREVIDWSREVPPISDPAAVRALLRNGRPLEGSVRTRMELGFGRSLGDVRFHTDGRATQLASAYSARAFTVGNNIVFGVGQYRPGTLAGDALIAHELAHTRQQTGAEKTQKDDRLGLERDATRSAVHAMMALHAEKHRLAIPRASVGPHLESGLSLHRCNDQASRREAVGESTNWEGLCPPSSPQTPGVGRLTSDRFVNLTRGTVLNTSALAAEPATAGAQLDQADENRDGMISGEGEWRTLYTLLNRYLGHRPNEPLLLRSREGITATGLIVAALGRLSGATRLRSEVGTVSLETVITLLGMSDTAIHEASALRRQLIPVQLITDIPGRRDEVRTSSGRQAFNLETSDGRQGFVNSLPLPAENRRQVLEVLNQVDSGARREVAELARVWSLAYCGSPIPRRVILSGHGDGTWISGDDHDFINRNSVLGLGRAMPRAAEQIYSFHISSCQHGYDTRMGAFRNVFPHLQMVWGYAGSSPSGSPAYRHMIVWERATRGFPAGGRPLDPSAIAGTRRADVTAVWTPSGGWTGPRVRPFQELLREATGSVSTFDRYLNGQLEVDNPGRGFMFDYYSLLQQLSVHPGMDAQPEAVRRLWIHRRNQALRLRLYRNVARNFQRINESTIMAGYRAMGLNPPNFGSLSRGAALAQIRSVHERLVHSRSSSLEANRLWRQLEGLRGLDEERIPMAWVE